MISLPKQRAMLLAQIAFLCFGCSTSVFGQFIYANQPQAVNVSYSPSYAPVYASPSIVPKVEAYESSSFYGSALPIETQSRPVTKYRVLIIVDSDCPNCEQLLAELERPGGDFQSMRNNGWRIGRELDSHIRIVDKLEVLGVVEQVQSPKFPIVLSVQKSIVSRSFQAGCTTPLDMWTFNWLITGIDSRPTPAPREPIAVPTSRNYPLRGGHWSVDGDWQPSRQTVINHVRGPAHGHQLRPEWNIDAWSYEELRSLHDDLHEAESGSRSMSFSSQASGRSASGAKRYGRSAASH